LILKGSSQTNRALLAQLEQKMVHAAISADYTINENMKSGKHEINKFFTGCVVRPLEPQGPCFCPAVN